MFGPPGMAYVYLVYGVHCCLNVVSGPDGAAGAVLLRSVEPIEGVEQMIHARDAAAARRGRGREPRTSGTSTSGDALHAKVGVRVAAGPGRLCAAFDLDRRFTGADLCDPASAVRLAAPAEDAPAIMIVRTPRIGVGFAPEPWRSLRWRVSVANSPALSVPVLVEGLETAPDG